MNTISDKSIPQSKMLIHMKVYHQETEYSCGAAVIKTLLDYYSILRNRSEADICDKLGTRFEAPHQGTHPDKMVRYLRDEGLNVEFGENKEIALIYHYIDQGLPVIVLDSTWGGHWRMIVGYDSPDNQRQDTVRNIFIADPVYKTINQVSNSCKGIMQEKEDQFYAKWFEDTLFERVRRRFYVVAYPRNKEIVRYNDNTMGSVI